MDAPTILFDEIDTVFGPKAEGQRGHPRRCSTPATGGARPPAVVSIRGKSVETEEICRLRAPWRWPDSGSLPDTIMTRSVVIRMRRRGSGLRLIEPFRRRVHAPIGEALRRRLAGWAAAIGDEATEARPSMPAGIEDRNADVWEPLFALADIAEVGWPKRARGAAVALVKVLRDEEPSPKGHVMSPCLPCPPPVRPLLCAPPYTPRGAHSRRRQPVGYRRAAGLFGSGLTVRDQNKAALEAAESRVYRSIRKSNGLERWQEKRDKTAR